MIASLQIHQFRRISGIIWRLFRGLQKQIIYLLRPLFLHNPYLDQIPLEKLGSDYGGWKVPVQSIDKDWICYCFGIGKDATFDMELVNKFSCDVFSFDPTPTALKYMNTLEYDKEKLHFYPWGIWKEDKELKFYSAVDPHDSNFSVFDLHGSGNYTVAECYTLSSIMTKLGHKAINLIKLDIEGSWYEVLKQIVEEEIKISVLCAEFDSPVSILGILKMCKYLGNISLILVDYENNNYVFVNANLLN